MLDRLEKLLEWGGTRRKVALLSVSGLALLMSMLGMEPLPFEVSWIAIVLCGVPVVLEAVLGLATAWDIKAGVLVSIALIASVIIGEDFAAGEVAFIMQLGELLEELTVARARKGIERLVRLTPATPESGRNQGGGYSGGRGSHRGYSPRIARRDDSGGRRYSFRAHFRQPVRNDGGTSSERQGSRG